MAKLAGPGERAVAASPSTVIPTQAPSRPGPTLGTEIWAWAGSKGRGLSLSFCWGAGGLSVTLCGTCPLPTGAWANGSLAWSCTRLQPQVAGQPKPARDMC